MRQKLYIIKFTNEELGKARYVFKFGWKSQTARGIAIQKNIIKKLDKVYKKMY
jgi:hypothetical protein